MGLFDESDIVKPKAPSNPNLISKPTDTVAVANSHNAYSNLITHIEGYKWVVTFYSQFLTGDMEPSHLALGRDSVYQQYLRIDELEFRVESPLNTSQDLTGGEFTVTGSGLMYPGIIPNRGDFFVAEIGDGKKAIIAITEVERPNLFKDVAYRITYMVRQYLDQELEKHISEKVVSRKIFVKDFFDYGKDPIIALSDYDDYRKLDVTIDHLTDLHFATFINREYKNLVIPDQTGLYLDPKFSRYVADQLHRKYDTDYEVISTDRAGDSNDDNLWDILRTRDMSRFDTMSYKNTLMSVSRLHWHPVINAIKYMGFNALYVPMALDDTCAVTLEPSPPRQFRRPIDIPALKQTTFKNINYHDLQAVSLDPFTETGTSEYYVFSKAFYEFDNGAMSLLERCVCDYLEGLPLQTNILLALAEHIRYQPNLTMFYQIPILILLLEAKMGDIN